MSTIARGCFVALLAITAPVEAREAQASATQPAASAEVLMQTLNDQLLASRSATATLETWCRDHRLAAEPTILAMPISGAEKPASAEQRRRLDVTATEPLKYRHVLLRCGTRVLSEADIWYVPARLTSEMNRLLETTDTPFGRAVAPLEPYRKTLEVTRHWRPADGGAIPDALFEHRAILYSRDHKPISEVVEVYQRAVLGR